MQMKCTCCAKFPEGPYTVWDGYYYCHPCRDDFNDALTEGVALLNASSYDSPGTARAKLEIECLKIPHGHSDSETSG